MRRQVAAAAIVLAVVGCGGGPSRVPIKLDGSPHPATDAGVITTADSHHIVVDGKRTYRVDRHLIVFSADTLQLGPLAGAVGRYSLLAARGGLVSWIEPLSVVTTFAGLPRTVFFFGVLTVLGQDQATFADGTVLPLAPGVGLASDMRLPSPVRAEIDPGTHRVMTLVPT